ncbi:MAG: agmatine deiminase family protein, partial [Minisyncoccia bacterium]
AWPYDKTTFTKSIENAEKTFCEIIKALEGSEKVELIVLNSQMQTRAENLLKTFEVDLFNITFHLVEYADVWTRDYAPLFLKKDVWTKWQYNVYGKAHEDKIYWEPLLKDNDVFNKINLLGQKFEIPVVLEGGSVEVNGQGSLITTEQCLLNPNRNPDLTKEQIEQNLKEYLGVSNVIWLKKGLVNDHTDGHIDDIVRFVASRKILACYEDDSTDENYEILKENYEILSQTDFEIVKLPMPHMKYDDGSKAPVSYANFYIGNTVVLVPVYDDLSDAKALEIIQSCFPERKVVGIDCREIIYGGGAIHCMTQQQPGV